MEQLSSDLGGGGGGELIIYNLLSLISELFHFACPLLQTKLVSFADFDSPKLYQGGKK